MTDEEHRILSLLRRDTFLIAKRHYELSRDYSALAATYKVALDERVPHVLRSTQHRKTVSSELQPSLFPDGTPGGPFAPSLSPEDD